MSTIESNLQNFVDQINSCERMTRLLKNWKRILEVDIAGDKNYAIVFDEHRASMVEGEYPEFSKVQLKADLLKANEVFSGELTPMEAYLDGDLEVDGSDEDQTKLDAISLIIWGD